MVEMLVTLVIVGLVAIIAGEFLTTDTVQRERLLAHADDQRNTLLAAEILREQLAPAGSGLSRTEPRLSFACNGKAMEVYAHYIDTAVAKPEERLFVFSIVSDRNGTRLTRGNYTTGSYNKGPRQPIVQDISQLSLIAVTDAQGARHEAATILPTQQLSAAVLEFSIYGAGGSQQVSTVFLPLVPTAWFQPSWGPICAQ